MKGYKRKKMRKTSFTTAIAVILLAALTLGTTFCALSLTAFASGTGNGGVIGDVTGAVESVVDDVTGAIEDLVDGTGGGAGHVGEDDGDRDGDGVAEGTRPDGTSAPSTTVPSTTAPDTTVADGEGGSMGIIAAIIAVAVVAVIIVVVVAVMPKKK